MNSNANRYYRCHSKLSEQLSVCEYNYYVSWTREIRIELAYMVYDDMSHLSVMEDTGHETDLHHVALRIYQPAGGVHYRHRAVQRY